MNYDTIIVEMLSRIQALEEKVNKMEEKLQVLLPETGPEKKVGTANVRDHIQKLKKIAKEQGRSYLILLAKDIHGDLHLKNRYPIVCNAMRQAMNENDEVLFSPEKGNSSTVKIKYYL